MLVACYDERCRVFRDFAHSMVQSFYALAGEPVGPILRLQAQQIRVCIVLERKECVLPRVLQSRS